jgi:hypothetical protein
MSFLFRLLTSDDVLEREVTALALGNVLLFAAWYLAYWVLPEGMLRSKTGASLVFGIMTESSLLVLMAQILLWNAVIAYGLTPLAAKYIVGRFPLAYLIGLGNCVLFGLYLGTNSLGHTYPSVPRPSWTIYLGTGPWELAVYLSVAAALARRYEVRQETLWTLRGERIRPSAPRLETGEWALLGLSAVLLLATAWLEARKIVGHG